MDIKSIKPYTKLWFDCKGNLYLSILQTVDDKFQYIAYNNEYHYDNKLVPTDNCEFTMLEMYTTWSIVSEMMRNVTNIDYVNDEQFFDAVMDLLNKGKYVFAGVDLYYWIEENFCHGVDHWFHSALIQRYDEENEIFYVFDVDSDKQYGIFTIGKKEFLEAVRAGFEQGEISFYCDIETDVEIKNITVGSLKKNAKKLINNISEAIKSDYFWMEPQDYEDRSYADLNHVFLGRISQRQTANSYLMEELYKRDFVDEKTMNKLRDMATELSKGWLLLQYKVNMLYIQKDINKKIENVNVRLKKLFSDEIKMWDLLYKNLELVNDDDVVFKFD